MAQFKLGYGMSLGLWPGGNPATAQSFALNAADDYYAFSVMLPATKTLNKVRVYVSSVASGPMQNGDMRCRICAETSAGLVDTGTVHATSTTITAQPNGAAWVEFTGFTYEMTAWTRYWVVIDNTAGATRTPTMFLARGGSAFGYGFAGQFTTSTLSGGLSCMTYDSAGPTTAQYGSCHGPLRLEFSNGSFLGMPFTAYGYATNKIYSTYQVGAYFTTPANFRGNAIGGMLLMATGGTLADSVQLKLFEGATLKKTSSHAVAHGILGSTIRTLQFFWNSAVALSPGTAYRLVGNVVAGGGDVSNYFGLYSYTWEEDANSKALVPYGARLTSDATGSWVETDTQVVPFGLVLDADGEYQAPSGGGILMVGG